MSTFSETIDEPWLEFEPIRVGRIPVGLSTPDRYLTTSLGSGQPVRVDLYHNNEVCAFEDAREWLKWLVIGWGEYLHWVDPVARTSRSCFLGSYFSAMYPTPDALFVASAERMFRFGASGSLVWTSGVLGIDGVLLDSWSDSVLVGRGEFDPPGGWHPFQIAGATGDRLDAENGVVPKSP